MLTTSQIDRIKSAANELEFIGKGIDELIEYIDELERDKDDLQDEINDLKDEISALEEENGTLTDKLEELQKEAKVDGV